MQKQHTNNQSNFFLPVLEATSHMLTPSHRVEQTSASPSHQATEEQAEIGGEIILAQLFTQQRSH